MASRSVEYEKAHSELSDRLGETIRDFACAQGLRTPTEANLRQMDRSLSQVASQLLWFGFDVWPKDIDDEGDGSSGGDNGPPPSGFSVLSACPGRIRSKLLAHRSLRHAALAASVAFTLILAPIGWTVPSEATAVQVIDVTPPIATILMMDLADDGVINGSVGGHPISF